MFLISTKSFIPSSASITSAAPRIGPQARPSPPTTIIEIRKSSSGSDRTLAPITRKCPAKTPPASPVKKAVMANTRSWYLKRLSPRETPYSGLSRSARKAKPNGLRMMAKEKPVANTSRKSER